VEIAGGGVVIDLVRTMIWMSNFCRNACGVEKLAASRFVERERWRGKECSVSWTVSAAPTEPRAWH
jgi:hypothetical protein